MERISVKELMMKTALLFAQRSTCTRVKAGSVIVVDRHIVSTGYNGNAPGQVHCIDYFKKQHKKLKTSLSFEDWTKTDEFKQSHHDWAIENELHGEMNALLFCSRKSISVEGGDIYTTYSPCIFCTKAIIQAGIKRVYYHTLYDRPEGHRSLEVLRQNKIHVEQVKIGE